MLNIAVLVSGGGTNLQALIDAASRGEIENGKFACVISSKPGAYALERAKSAGISTEVLVRKEFETMADYDAALLAVLDWYHIDLIVLAGFMTIISGEVISRYRNRIINVHPALIPAFCGEGFYGLRVHSSALDKGVKVTGATVHFVNEICDGGPIILQKAVDVLPGDTPETLQRRVMEQAEWKLLPQAVSLFCQGRLAVADNRVTIVKEKDGSHMLKKLAAELSSNEYPGRGIVLGKSADGNHAVIAYFIMGRSENSRNRVFTAQGSDMKTEAFDPAKLKDPSLIIYSPVRVLDQTTIVTNGDQTDTVYEFLAQGKTFEDALRTRTFEPDEPNYTPRISGMVNVEKELSYRLSILKSAAGNPDSAQRFFFEYSNPLNGQGHFIHTYQGDGNPLPSFPGEPTPVEIQGSLDEFTAMLWKNLNEDNKVSLFTRFIDLKTGEAETRIVNKNQ